MVKSRASYEEVLSSNPVHFSCNIADPENIIFNPTNMYIVPLVTGFINYLFSKYLITYFWFHSGFEPAPSLYLH